MKRTLAVVFALTFLISMPVLAQGQEGDTEFQLQGALTLNFDDDVEDTGLVNALYGHFISDRQEVGASVTALFLADGDLGGIGGPFYRYNFIGNPDRVPYVGGSLFGTFGDFSRGDLFAELEAGVRFFLNRNTAFTVEGSTLYDIDESELSDSLNIFFGFSYFWSR